MSQGLIPENKSVSLLNLPMTGWQRFVMGGAGALAPIFVNLLVVDMHTTFEVMAKDPRVATWLALEYVIKVVALFVVGGVVAYMHDDETKATKLFQFGLGAPALILAGMNGVSMGELRTENQRVVAAAAVASGDAAQVFKDERGEGFTNVTACVVPPAVAVASEGPQSQPARVFETVVEGKAMIVRVPVVPVREEVKVGVPPGTVDLQAVPPQPRNLPLDFP